MQVNKNNITQFLTSTNMSFMIPVYQRNYDWTEDNCKQLWNDIWYVSQSADAQTHFLGTVCSKTVNGHEKTIIDGQQRITTISLLMKAMHDYVDNDEFKKDIDSNFLHNTGYGVAEGHKVKLHLNRRDDAVFNKLLKSSEFTHSDALTAQEVESSIYQNYAYFYKCLTGLSEDQIAGVRAALDRIVIVDLDVETENPQEIFESLNSTGLDLTDVDLLRNFLLMSLEYGTQVELYDDYWFEIEQNVDPRNMVRFFVDYLIYVKKSDAVMIHGRRAHINENNLYAAFKDYYRMLSGEKNRYYSLPGVTEVLLKDMHECSKIYRSLVFESGVDMNSLDDIDRIIYSIVYINQSVASRPVLMYILANYQKKAITKEQTLAMLNACLSMVFRSKVVGVTGINGQFAGNVIQKLPEEDMESIVDVFWKAITSGSGKFACPSDKEFKEALLNRQVFEVLRSKWTKYMLYSLEQNTKASKGLPRYDDANISVEHIMPKTLSEEWQEYLGEDAFHHDDFLNKLGNLALTSNNAEMSNNAFGKKQDWYSESSFSYTRRLCDCENWSIQAIRERSQQLAERCLEVWPMPAEYQPIVQDASHNKRRPPFRFSMIGLAEGDEIAFIEDPGKIATVVDDSRVEYGGETHSLSFLAGLLLGRENSTGIAGPHYFTYDGEVLDAIRTDVEANMF